MPNELKRPFLQEITRRFGTPKKLNDSLSLFDLANGAARIYIRYSKLHGGKKTFFGLRESDLRTLEGHPSVICFLWDRQVAPLLVPYSEYEQVFQSVEPAKDGQFKAQVYPQEEGTELYIANAGRFNVEDHIGWTALENLVDSSAQQNAPMLSHSQVQTLLGSIGATKGFDIWIPTVDRLKLDWATAPHYYCCEAVPYGFEAVKNVLQEIDVVWIQRGSGQISALFEVEHSTPIYSGLLRFNDIHLVAPNLRPKFSIVANDARRDVYVTQLTRPTFRLSGLSEMCNFLEYENVYRWYRRLTNRGPGESINSSPG
jgi:hypothetical protein